MWGIEINKKLIKKIYVKDLSYVYEFKYFAELWFSGLKYIKAINRLLC